MSTPEIFVRDFFGAGDAASDLIPALQRAVRKLHDRGGGRLILPAGVHHLRPESAEELPLSISNNEPGFKFVGIHLHGLRNVEIVGNGTTLIMRDRLVPFLATDCCGLQVHGIILDWNQPFYGQAIVLESGPHDIIAHLDRTIPWDAWNGRLTFRGEGWTGALEHAFEMDAKLRRPALGSHDNCGAGWLMQWNVDNLGDDRIRLSGKYSHPPAVGNALILRPGEQRDNPAIVLNRCRDVSLFNLTVHHAGGMGLIAQRSSDILVKQFNVVPSGHRFFSTTVDATHFVGCAGNVIIEDSRMEAQLDDPANIHGIYTQVVSVVSAHTLRVRLVHPQQRGFEFAAPGDLLSLVRKNNLSDYWQSRVVEIKPLNRQWLDISFHSRLPGNIATGDSLDNLDWHPHVTIRRCWMGGNRARGPLLGSRASTLIEDNHFATPGAAIHSSPDCNFWFESAPVTNVTIRRNTFEECAHEAEWGAAPINLDPNVTDPKSLFGPLQSNVVIEENVFKTINGACVRARHVKDLVIRNNTVVDSTRPEAKTLPRLPAWDLQNCPGHVLTENPPPS